MVESLFIEKSVDRKLEAVKDHYERAYGVKLKSDLTPSQIEGLYKNLQLLKSTEFFYNQK